MRRPDDSSHVQARRPSIGDYSHLPPYHYSEQRYDEHH
jgi:hypothetical protein